MKLRLRKVLSKHPDARPLVSVIIPVYNGSNYLREAIDSVLAQTYQNYEIIVVDDGSTDGTWSIIQSYGDKVRGFHKENGGVATALNDGIRNMKGQWFAWLSHDDVWLPQKLEEQVQFLSRNNLKICYSDFFLIDEKGQKIQQVSTPDTNQIEEIFGSGIIHGSSIMIERSCFDSCGLFSETKKYTQDIDMWLRLCVHYHMGRVGIPLILSRRHGEQGCLKFKKEMLQEEKATYVEFIKNLNFSDIFPDACAGTERTVTDSNKYLWFGNLMYEPKKWYLFALMQYLTSFRIWPSLKNPSLKTFFYKTARFPYLISIDVTSFLGKTLNWK